MSGFASPGVFLFESVEAGSDFQPGFSRLIQGPVPRKQGHRVRPRSGVPGGTHHLVAPAPARCGRTDFVFPKSRTAVFVDGCFWHGMPNSR